MWTAGTDGMIARSNTILAKLPEDYSTGAIHRRLLCVLAQIFNIVDARLAASFVLGPATGAGGRPDYSEVLDQLEQEIKSEMNNYNAAQWETFTKVPE